jgi:hypothetical protein
MSEKRICLKLGNRSDLAAFPIRLEQNHKAKEVELKYERWRSAEMVEYFFVRASTVGLSICCTDGCRQPRRTNFNYGRHRWDRYRSNRGRRLWRARHIFNHTNFAFPNTNADSGQFGQITQTISQATTIYGSGLGADASPRVIELRAKFVF